MVTGGTTTAWGSRATGRTTTVMGGKAMVTVGMATAMGGTTTPRGSRTKGDRWHDDGKGQQGDGRHNDAARWW